MEKQPRLPLQGSGILYECLNSGCFYNGSLLAFEDVSWKDFYNHQIGDLDLRPVCPSCREPMATWHDESEENDAEIQTQILTSPS